MSPVSPYVILPIILIALATAKLSSRILRIAPGHVKFAPIDGLRGYMAFFVFLHHSCIWFYCSHGRGWGAPPSNIYSQFGSTSVGVFFMITSFLFFSKLLEHRKSKMDWLKLYVSRGLRIMPLYAFALFILLTIVAILSGFSLHEPVAKVLVEISQWLLFIKVNINGLNPTWLIIAGVVWSLPYEWLFYFILPWLGLTIRIKASPTVLAFSMVGIFIFVYVILTFYQSAGALSRMYPFIGGIAAAIIARIPLAKEWATGIMASVVISLLLILTVGLFPTIYRFTPLLMLSIAFIGIACGNSLFGILTHPLSRILGQISYSIYLLHGIVLFVTFNWILGFKIASRFSPLVHWGIIALCGMAVVFICSITYRLIEKPSMDTVPAVTDKLRRKYFFPVHFSS